jgi:hypothetical protein
MTITTRTITTAAMLAAAGMLTMPEPARAQTVVPNGASVVEWDVPDAMAIQPNALVINDVVGGKRGPVWYVTATSARLVRFVPPSADAVTSQLASFTSFDVGGFTNQAFGFRIAPGQFAFVHSDAGMHRWDTINNVHVLYFDNNGNSRSDVGIDPSNSVYTTAPEGFVDRLTPVSDAVCASNALLPPCAQLTQWAVGGHPGGSLLVPLEGVAVHPGTGKQVYFSDASNNRIGKLDITTNMVTYYPLAPVATMPGQMVVSFGGDVFTVAQVGTNGGIVRLDTKKNQLTPLTPADAAMAQFAGIADTGIIGFTESNKNSVGMFVKGGTSMSVTPSTPAMATRTDSYVSGMVVPSDVSSGTAFPVAGSAPVLVSGTNATGVFEEAALSNSDSPLVGIGRDPGPLGTFFYAVNGSTNRIGRVFIPIQLAKLASGHGKHHATNDNNPDDSPDPQHDASFDFTVSQQDALTPPDGILSYSNPVTGDNIDSVAITDLTIVDHVATITGTCLNNGLPCTFTATATDNLLLGTPDTFAITPVLGTPAAGGVTVGTIRNQ